VVATGFGYAAAAAIGALILYAMMIYVILPVAKPLMVDMTLRGAVIVEHILYGGVPGWWRASRWPRG
jgi:hypothetical protein